MASCVFGYLVVGAVVAQDDTRKSIIRPAQKCPSIPDSVFTSTLLEIAMVANVCLRLLKRTCSSMPAFFSSFRLILDTSSGLAAAG